MSDTDTDPWEVPASGDGTPRDVIDLPPAFLMGNSRRFQGTRHVTFNEPVPEPLTSSSHAAASAGGDAISLKKENERLQETVAALEAQIDALRVELKESQWSADRAVELGKALASATEESMRSKKEAETLKSQVAELNRLNAVQLELLDQLDAEHEATLPTSVTAKTGRPLLRRDPEMSQASIIEQLTRRLERESRGWAASNAKSVVNGHLIGVVPALGVPCLQCLQAAEAKAREEIALIERDGFSQFECRADALRRQNLFLMEQNEAREIELMWREDMQAHQDQLLEIQSVVGSVTQLAEEHKKSKTAAATWEKRFLKLKKDGDLAFQRLQYEHEDELKETRVRLLRANPSADMLRHLFVSNLKTHHGHGLLLMRMGRARKHLWYLRQLLEGLKDEFAWRHAELQGEVMKALEKALPSAWCPVRMARPVARGTPQRRTTRSQSPGNAGQIVPRRPSSTGRRK